ncbi:MAG: hypothetical protein VX438_07625, partial [Planctomycetota bacterium]|nr:hypothetical protein [Planctomycetota bacterium]
SVFLQSGDISETIGNNVRGNPDYDATLENVVILSAKEKDQEIYSHKFKARVYRAPELKAPDIPPDELAEFMKPRKLQKEEDSKEVENESRKETEDPVDTSDDAESDKDEADQDSDESPKQPQQEDEEKRETKAEKKELSNE